MAVFGGWTANGLSNDFFALEIRHYGPHPLDWEMAWVSLPVAGLPSPRAHAAMIMFNRTIFMYACSDESRL
jgi:hypothetical protein